MQAAYEFTTLTCIPGTMKCKYLILVLSVEEAVKHHNSYLYASLDRLFSHCGIPVATPLRYDNHYLQTQLTNIIIPNTLQQQHQTKQLLRQGSKNPSPRPSRNHRRSRRRQRTRTTSHLHRPHMQSNPHRSRRCQTTHPQKDHWGRVILIWYSY